MAQQGQLIKFLHSMCIRVKFPGINPQIRPSNVSTELILLYYLLFFPLVKSYHIYIPDK
jgi:hypothetical protein